MYYANDYGFSNWDQELYKYDPVGVSREVGPLWVGTTDTADLNNTFDEVLLDGGVYHVMCHPNVIEWDQDYPWIHLEHISNRNNVWYTGFGHLYAYHFLQSTYPGINLHTMNPNKPIPEQIVIHQNYPNPFNPSTTISFSVPTILDVKIAAYNVVGHEVSTLLNKTVPVGMQSVMWNAQAQPSGMYFIRMQSGDFIGTQKVMLLK
jgi:hypothetical protein